jgi:hypothetical protein
MNYKQFPSRRVVGIRETQLDFFHIHRLQARCCLKTDVRFAKYCSVGEEKEVLRVSKVQDIRFNWAEQTSVMGSTQSGEDRGFPHPNPFKRDSWWRVGVDVLT